MKKYNINLGDQYKIKESGKILIVRSKDKNKDFFVHYYDNSKPDLKLKEEHINHYLNFGSWIKVKI